MIVEDHLALAENLFEYFSSEDYELDFAADGMTALHLVTTNSYDVLVLDVMLPGFSGYELCHRIRRKLGNDVPILLMTAKDSLDDKETGFGEGADDYLTKPFHLRELQMRVDALHRRHLSMNASLLKADCLAFNPGTLTVTIADTAAVLELSGTAAQIFELLMRNYPNILSHDRLREAIWGEDGGDLHSLRTHVYSLRKQFREAFGASLIKTAHGIGYRLAPPER